jgi:proline iminopeptidase
MQFLINRIIFLFLCIIFSSAILAIQPTQQDYLDVDDGQIYYQTFGHGEPIIVLHGGPGLDQSYLLPQMEELAKHYSVTFYDQRGSGRSIKTPMNNDLISVPQFVKDLDALRAKLGYEKFILIGHSWGGLLAMNYAIAHPEHVNALILMDSAGATGASFQELNAEYYRRTADISKKLNKIQSSRDFLAGDPAAIKKFYRLIFTKYMVNPKNVNKLTLNINSKSALNGFKVAGILQKNYLDTEFNLLPELAKLDIPTLIIYGKYDLIPRKSMEEIKNTMPDAELVVLQHSAHFSYIEQPQQTFAAIEDFLRLN